MDRSNECGVLARLEVSTNAKSIEAYDVVETKYTLHVNLAAWRTLLLVAGVAVVSFLF